MPYNLLRERWIPVRRASGGVSRIAPYEITDPADPPLRVESGRPDFDGALTQFLIGLLQTAAAPAGQLAWRRWLLERPTDDVLQRAFAKFEPAFDLDGDGPRFLQDFELRDGQGKELPIGALLINLPARNTTKRNGDLFVKRDAVRGLCRACAAAALMALQTNAPKGGSGHFTSLRGGGPLTTLILGDDLWKTLWLNVLDENQFRSVPGEEPLSKLPASFPWLAPTRTSKGNRGTTTKDASPLQHYWGMPRRIRIWFHDSGQGNCGIHDERGLVITRFSMPNHGVDYEGEWLHPLTPYVSVAGSPRSPRKGRPEGAPYRDWPLWTYPASEHMPARVVHAFLLERRSASREARLWVFGYDMDDMKARSWNDAIMPLLGEQLPPEQAEDLASFAQQCVAASESARKDLAKQVREAMLHPGRVNRAYDSTAVSARFWSDTERDFFSTLRRKAIALEREADESSIAEDWLRTLHQAARKIFQSFTEGSEEADFRRVALAWSKLGAATHPDNTRMRALVGLGPVRAAKRAQGGPRG